jgi:hypothetical protein
MVAHKTSTLFSLNASLINLILPVAFDTIIHFHPVPGIFLESPNVASPNIPAVSGDPILFIHLQAFRFANRTMAFDAIHSGFLYMSRMGKKHAGRLS